MKTYNVIISDAADADLMYLALFLRKVMSIEGAWKYHQNMLGEVKSLSILADIYSPSRYADIAAITPKHDEWYRTTNAGSISFTLKMTPWLLTAFFLRNS